MTDAGHGFRFHEEQRLPGPLAFLRLVVTVDGQHVHVRLSSLLSPFSRRIPLVDVVGIEVNERISGHVPGLLGRLRVIGFRTAPGFGTVHNLTARAGVALRLRNGRRAVIGSRRPHELAAAVRDRSSA